MKRLVCVVSLLALAAVPALMASAAARQEPSVKEIMKKAHKGPDSPIASVGKELRGDDPDWAEIQSLTKDLVKLGTSLGKNDPPQGEKGSWQTLTRQYLANAKSLNSAAEKKDKSAAQAAHKKLTGSCKACHQVHRPS